MMINAAFSPDFRGLIEHQSVEIELMRAQIAAFMALAQEISTGGRALPNPIEAVTRREA